MQSVRPSEVTVYLKSGHTLYYVGVMAENVYEMFIKPLENATQGEIMELGNDPDFIEPHKGIELNIMPWEIAAYQIQYVADEDN